MARLDRSLDRERVKQRITYGELNGEHRVPKWDSLPEGPQPTRKDRPSARPKSINASSWPVKADAELSTLAYFLVGWKGAGSMSCAKDARYIYLSTQNNPPPGHNTHLSRTTARALTIGVPAMFAPELYWWKQAFRRGST